MASRLNRYHTLFGRYARRYLRELLPGQMRAMAALKAAHSQRVRSLMKELGMAAGLDEHMLLLAETAGLFHDIGRFEQLRRFGTFVDRISVNHAQLSAETVLEEGFISDLSEAECRVVIAAIRRHNMKQVPPARDFREAILVLMLRDADKLDIWQVFHNHYQSGNRGTGDETLELGMPDTAGITRAVASAIMDCSIVDLSDVHNRNDFALARLAWIFDINFVRSLEIIRERGYIPALAAYLPEFEQKTEIFTHCQRWLDDTIAHSTSPC